MIVGRHLIFDAIVEDTDLLRDAAAIEARFRHVFAAHAVSILRFSAHSFPGAGGVTGVFLLAESHASFHTWPEYRLLCADMFTCGDTDLSAMFDMLREDLALEHPQSRLIARGNRCARPAPLRADMAAATPEAMTVLQTGLANREE